MQSSNCSLLSGWLPYDLDQFSENGVRIVWGAIHPPMNDRSPTPQDLDPLELKSNCFWKGCEGGLSFWVRQYASLHNCVWEGNYQPMGSSPQAIRSVWWPQPPHQRFTYLECGLRRASNVMKNIFLLFPSKSHFMTARLWITASKTRA
jgi:hypothetical protein